jgi:hypothetical protein
MANTPISGFTSGAPAQSTDELVIARSGANFKLTADDLKTLSIGDGSVSIASGKTLTGSNTLTLAGTDGTTMTFPATSATLARTDAGNTFTGAQTFSVGTVNGTGLDVTQTWGATGTYTGLKYNVTDSGPSNAASLLMDLQVGGTSQFRVTKAGATQAVSFRMNGPATTYSIGYANAQNPMRINTNGSAVGGFFDAHLGFDANYAIAWSTGGNAGFSPDLFLTRRAAANLRLGAADAAAPVAQTLSVQSGVTGASATTVSISGTALTIAGTVTGTIAIGHAVTGTGVSAGTLITAGSGTSWTVNNSQTVGPITAYFNSVGRDFTITGNQASGPSAGGSIVFQVAPAGAAATTAQNALVSLLTLDASNRAVTINATGGSYSLIPIAGQNALYMGENPGGNYRQLFTPNGVIIGSDQYLAWHSALPNIAQTPDTFLRRDAANTLALRNGTAAQTFNVYNTFTDASNYERGFTRWASNVFEIGTEAAGTGTVRELRFPMTTSTTISFHNASDRRMTLTFNTNFIINNPTTGIRIGADSAVTLGGNNVTPDNGIGFGTNGSVAVGRDAAMTITHNARVSDLAAKNFSVVGAAAWASATTNIVGGRIELTGGAGASGSAGVANGGNILLDGGQGYGTGITGRFVIGSTRATLTAFGGTTSSFPALKSSSTTLQVRLADDSANAPLESASVKTDAPAGGTSGTWKLGVAATVSPTSPNRTIEVDIGGTIYYIAAKTTND